MEVDLADESLPLYKQIAARALALHQEGKSNVAIGRELGVHRLTVAKAIAWLKSSQ